MSNSSINFFWFRRDLRLEDNAGLYHALNAGLKVQCVFIFDTEILNRLEDKRDARVVFILQELANLNDELKKYGASLLTIHDTPLKAWEKWMQEFRIHSVYTNHDYEPYARKRDDQVAALLKTNKVSFHTFKDQVIFEKSEVMKSDGSPYTVFTPYKNQYLKQLEEVHYSSYPVKKLLGNLNEIKTTSIPQPEDLGFETFQINFSSKKIDTDILNHYADQRDFPGIKGTSRLSVHLRFGTVSIRKLMATAIKEKSEKWRDELIWRDFYQMIIWNFPHVAKSAFKPGYDTIPWRNNEQEFELWCEGKTGYPIVDAGMRELNTTGFMHNRVRMITASFLVKHLLIDWRWGEAYFAKKLNDFDLASNNGGWQWAAGSGCDAAPYFRIFNPAEQTKKFDSDFKYIRKWVPEFEDFSYPAPVVDHKFARERCLAVFAKALKK